MKKTFDILNIFRGIFASMVMFFHLSPFADTPVINNNFILNSDLFVDFFFVLSGFVIAYSYSEIDGTRNLTEFYKKRFLRIYPLHIIMLVSFFCIEMVKQYAANYVQVNQLNNPNNNLTSLVSSIFLVNSIPIPGVNDVSWNIPSWSLSAEMISYFLFGILMLAISRFRIERYRNVIFIFTVVSAACCLYLFTGGFRLTYSFNYGFLRGIMGFFTGVLCLNAYKHYHDRIDSLPKVFFHTAEASLLVLIGVLVYHGQTLKDYGHLFEVLFFCSILVFAFEKGFVSGKLRSVNLLHKAGKYSYSIYLTHALVVSVFNVVFIRILKLPPSSYSYLFIVNCILVFKFSELTFKYIEMRFSSKKARVADRPRVLLFDTERMNQKQDVKVGA